MEASIARTNSTNAVLTSPAFKLDNTGRVSAVKSELNRASNASIESVAAKVNPSNDAGGCRGSSHLFVRLLKGIGNALGVRHQQQSPKAVDPLAGLYHGTGGCMVKDLIKDGLQEDFEPSSKSLVNNKYGDGFYTTSDRDSAAEYARSHAAACKKAGCVGRVLKVYTDSRAQLELGTHFDIGKGQDDKVVVFRIDAHDAVKLERFLTVPKGPSDLNPPRRDSLLPPIRE